MGEKRPGPSVRDPASPDRLALLLGYMALNVVRLSPIPKGRLNH